MRTVHIGLVWLVGLLLAQPPLKTIQEIQTPVNLAAGNDTSVLHGQLVRVRGVVVTECDWHRHFNVSGGPNSYRCSIWLQENGQTGPGTGLQIRRQNITDKPVGFTALQQGQYVELQGTVGYFQGEIQLIVDTTVSPIILAPNVPLAPPAVITPTDLNQAGSLTHNLQAGDQWQGSFVKLIGLTILSVSTNPLRITAQDANNNQVLIFGEFKGLGSTTTYVPGTSLDSVKGIVLHYWPGTGTPTYEVCPWHDSLVYIGNPVPIVSNLSRTPVCPPPNQPVTVSVSVTSNDPVGDPITAVNLFYAIGNSTTYTMVPMTQVGSSSTYEAIIPGQPEGTYVHYYVQASDLSGDVIKRPIFEPQSYRPRNGGCRISDIQYVVSSVLYAYNPTGRRDYLGSGYAGLQVMGVPGIVVASQNPSDTSLGYVYIQEPGATQWGGIWVRGAGLDNLRVGDSVVVDVATVNEYFGLTNLNNATVTRIGPASSTIMPVLLPLNVVYGDTQYAATEPYESMLVRFRHDNPTQPLHVVATTVSTQSQHAGDYRVGMDPVDPSRGIRVLAGRQTNNIFSSLNVSYVNDSTWAVQDGLINPALPLCIVTDTTVMDSLQGILTYQWNFVKLLPRNNKDFWNVRGTTCTQTQGPSALTGGLRGLVAVYPNPIQQAFVVDLPVELGEVEAALLSASGQVLARRRLVGPQVTWEASSLPAGLYLLQLTTSKGILVLPLVRL